MPEDMSDRVPEDMPEDLPDRMPEDMPDHMPEDMPNRMSEDMSDRMLEDLPVRKCINVMAGITRSKVIFHILGIIIPTDYIIFFRGAETTNQMATDDLKKCSKGHSSIFLLWKGHSSIFLLWNQPGGVDAELLG